MDVVIKKIIDRDCGKLSAFFEHNNICDIVKKFNPFPLNEKTAYFIANEEHKDKYYGAFFENDIIGFYMLRGMDDGYEIPSFGILVDFEYQKKDIGKKMMQHAIQESLENKYPAIRLSVYNTNEIAVRLYKKFGFVEQGGYGDKMVMIKYL